MKFLLYDGVVVPENEGIIIRLVLDNTEFGIYVILHFESVTVQMVWSDVHQHGDIGMELIHVVELEAAEFNDIIVIITFSHLISQTLPDIACQSHIQACFLEDVINQ